MPYGLGQVNVISIKKGIILALLFVACFSVSSVYAITITQTQAFTLSDGPKSGDLPFAATSILTFDKFDASLGTLMNISVDFSGELQASGSATVVNTHPCTGGTGGVPDPDCINSISGSLSLSSLIGSLTFPDAFAIPTIDFSGTPTGGVSCDAFSPDTNCTLGVSGAASTVFNFSESIAPFTTSAMDRAFFIGSGDYDLQLNAQALFSSLASIGAIVTSDNGILNWAGSAQVTYSYDLVSPAPEPSALVLLTVGLAGIGFSRRVKD